MLHDILLGVLILVGAAMVGVILLQQSEGGGIVSGGSGNLISARGAGNLLTKTTQILAAIFFVLSLLITVLTGREAGSSSLANRVKLKGIDPSVLQKQIAPGAPASGQLPTGAPAPVPVQTPPPFGTTK